MHQPYAAAGQRKCRDVAVGPSTVSCREQLGAIDGERRVGGAAEQSAAEGQQPHRRATDAERTDEQHRRQRHAHSQQRPPSDQVGEPATGDQAERCRCGSAQGEQGDASARVAAHIVEITVEEERSGGDEEVRRHRDHGDDGESTAVETRRHRVTSLEANGLGKAPHEVVRR